MNSKILHGAEAFEASGAGAGKTGPYEYTAADWPEAESTHLGASGISPVLLTSGVDAMYLSGSTAIPADVIELLTEERRRASAASKLGRRTTICIGNHEVEVGWGRWQNYQFRLEIPGFAMIGLLPTSPVMPAIRVEPRAHALHAEGPQAVLRQIYDLTAYLGMTPAWTVSRLDLFADFHDFQLTSESRKDFVCKAKTKRTFENGDNLETLYFGSGNPVMARLYDKTKESSAKGTDWWPLIWGRRYRRGQKVWRIEFEVHREYLRILGLSSPEDVLSMATPVWQELTSDWLSMRTPTSDSNRSRWPLAPQWEAVQAVEIEGSAIGAELIRAGQRQGDLRKLTPQAIGHLASVAALLGGRDADDLLELLPTFIGVDAIEREMSFADRVTDKRLAYNIAQASAPNSQNERNYRQ
jgi:hypothetical protein